MCGIVGQVQHGDRQFESGRIERMLNWLQHRGPDDRGVWCRGPIGVGNARLSIIDLELGKQPMTNEAQTVCVVSNGEIYNFRELRADLEAKGRLFRTSSDTEVILQAYEEWGVDCLPRLKGMFALAIVDTKRNKLYLARDIAGEKPLFYTKHAKLFAFASEIKPLLNELSISRDIEPLAIQSFFAFSRPVGNLCAFRSVSKLRPGEMLALDIETGDLTVSSYWQPPAGKWERSSDDAAEALHDLLKRTIQLVGYADVPVGAFLSGGIDSSLVVALMSQGRSDRLKTFTATYDDSHISEAREAQAIANILGSEHHEVRIEPKDVLAVLPKLVWHLEEPFADASCIPSYFVSKRASEFVKVALTGDGGDELFGGYDSYLAWRVLERYRRLPAFLRSIGKTVINAVSLGSFAKHPRLYHYVAGAKRVAGVPDDHNDIASFLRLMGQEGLTTLLSPQVREALFQIRLLMTDGYRGEESLDRIMFFQFRGLLPELFFTKLDRMSMACSLECRSPLVFRDLSEFALQMPTSLKLRGTTQKYLLKRVLERYLPAQLIYRPKKGFTIPFYRWLREEPVLRAVVEYYVFGQGSHWLQESEAVDCAVIVTATREFLAGAHNHWVLPWKAVCFGLWWETFVISDGSKPIEYFNEDVSMVG
jgi:asparagine synthase (glutamine-hydrolysing)